MKRFNQIIAAIILINIIPVIAGIRCRKTDSPWKLCENHFLDNYLFALLLIILIIGGALLIYWCISQFTDI